MPLDDEIIQRTAIGMIAANAKLSNVEEDIQQMRAEMERWRVTHDSVTVLTVKVAAFETERANNMLGGWQRNAIIASVVIMLFTTLVNIGLVLFQVLHK